MLELVRKFAPSVKKELPASIVEFDQDIALEDGDHPVKQIKGLKVSHETLFETL